MKVSSLAKELKPYVIRWINDAGGGTSLSAGNGGGGGTGGAPTDASYVVISANATLTAERIIASGDGIDLTDGGAGGNITIAVDVTDIIDTNFGLTESSNDIRISLAGTSGLSFSSGDLQIDDSVAGVGLSISSKVLAVNAGEGLTTSGDDIELGLPSTLTASTGNDVTGTTHEHEITTTADGESNVSTILQSDANGDLRVRRIGAGTDATVPIHGLSTGEVMRLAYDGSNYASYTVSSGGNLTVAPTGDFVFDPVGNDILPNTGYDLNIGSLQKKYLTIHGAELAVETLVAQDTIATIGGRILVGPTTVLTRDLGSGDTTIYVKNNEMANGDRAYMEVNANVEFIAITSGPTLEVEGDYSYSVTRNLDGSGANDWYAGDAVFNTGTTGDGFIDLYSFSGVDAGSTTGPTIVGNVRNSATYNDWTEHWAIGNLDGIYGYGSTEYGIGLGEYQGSSYMTIDSSNGIRFFDSSDNVVGEWVAGGDLTLGLVATDKANLFWDQSEGRLNFRGDTNGTVVQAYIDTDGSITAGNGTVVLDTDGITLTEGAGESNEITWKDSSANEVSFIQTNLSSQTFLTISTKATSTLSSSDATIFMLSEGDSVAVQSSLEVRADRTTAADSDLRYLIGSNYEMEINNTGMQLLNGLYVGAMTDPVGQGVITATDYVVALGGLHVGGTSDPGTDNLIVDGTMYLGDTANTNITQGITINQGANDNQLLAIKSSDVAHGMTTFAETDTYGYFQKVAGNDGGTLFVGLTEDVRGMHVSGFQTSGDTTKSAAADAAVLIQGALKSGTGVTNLGTNANLCVWYNNNSAVALIDAEGDLHLDGGVSASSWDDYNDIELLTGLRATMTPSMHDEFSDWIQSSCPVLEKTGVVTYNPDGRHFVSMKALQMLQIDAMRQMYGRIQELEEELYGRSRSKR